MIRLRTRPDIPDIPAFRRQWLWVATEEHILSKQRVTGITPRYLTRKVYITTGNNYLYRLALTST